MKCLDCGHDNYGKVFKDELGYGMICELCGSSFDISEEDALTIEAEVIKYEYK